MSDDVDHEFLRSSARAFLSNRGDKQSVDDLAAMDWLGLLVDEEFGGAGWLPVECVIVAEELGRAHDRSGWAGTVTAAAALAGAPQEIRERWLPDLVAGAHLGGFALAEPVVRVAGGDRVDILVTADAGGLSLYDTPRALPRLPDADSLDINRPTWCLDLSEAHGTVIGDAARASELRCLAILLVSADAVGALSLARERLVEYLRTRIAFGVPIASFQAIQHRLVDLLVFEVKARAIVMKAARACAHAPDSTTTVALAAAAHAFVATHATAAVDECMQLSGGIGFTWEYPLHHELRRVSADAWSMGTARSSRALLAEVSGW